MTIQYIIVAFIIAAAVFYVARSVIRSAKGHSCETGSCGCEKKTFKKV